MDRRKFLSLLSQTGLSLAATPAVNLALAPAALASIRKKKLSTSVEKHRVVIIGTGYGGAVAARRLSDAGVDCLMLERGIRWPIREDGNTFPTWHKPDERCAWLKNSPQFPLAPPALFRKFPGLIERINGVGMDIIAGAGVGGSSLVNGAMYVKPPKNAFERIFGSLLNYDQMAKYYSTVSTEIGISSIPDDVLASERFRAARIFLEHATKAGLKTERFFSATDWDIVRDELEGDVVPSFTVGEGMYGINSGAKKSLDRNYLARAEATGRVEIYTLHDVKQIYSEGSGFVVECHQLDLQGDPIRRKLIHCEKLFLGAGSAGTTRLMVRAKWRGDLPRLNSHVGKHWGNNGDRLFARIALKEKTLVRQGAPAAVRLTHFENSIAPLTFVHGPAPLRVETRALLQLGMGIPDQLGEFRYNAIRDEAVLHWSRQNDQTAVQAMRSVMKNITKENGGAWVDMGYLTQAHTYHPLGGMVMGKACDPYGHVYGYDNLYCVDASLIPGSAGCVNPAWTVASVAERCVERLLDEVA